MTPAEWNRALRDVPAVIAGNTVAQQVRALLDGGAYFLTTTELADLLYPPQHARGDDGMAARKRLFACLRWLAENGMAPYATRGDPVIRTRYGRKRVEHPLIWHAPIETKRRCPNCGVEL